MVLQYRFGGKQYTLIANWTDSAGHSEVYQDIVGKLAAKHGPVFTEYRSLAEVLDESVDKLYERIYIYGNESHALPYDPRDRKLFLQAFSDICDAMAAHIRADRSEEERALAQLFLSVLDRLQEVTGIYLLDNAYRRKHSYRRAELEEWAETTSERKMAYEFEDSLVQLTDVNNALNLLTERERRRLIKYFLLKNTFQEIADQEGVKKQSIEESVSTALKKVKSIHNNQ